MKIYDKEKFVSDSIRITPEEMQKDSERVENGEERRIFAMIAMQIRRALRKQGISQTEFARRLGVDPSIVTRYLSGKHNFQLRTLVKVQQVLNIEILNNWYLPKPATRKKSETHTLVFYVKDMGLKEKYKPVNTIHSGSSTSFSEFLRNPKPMLWH